MDNNVLNELVSAPTIRRDSKNTLKAFCSAEYDWMQEIISKYKEKYAYYIKCFDLQI